jgi:large subunit ribosomal protein L25
MSHSKLQVETRTIIGKRVRTLRRDGLIPAVIYKKNLDSVLIQIPYGEFVKVFKQAGKTHVIDISVDTLKYSTIIQDIDIDPIRSTPRHIDFLAVDLNILISTQVPVTIVGEARGVKENGLVLTQMVKELEVSCLPDNIPEQIEVDVTELLEIGDHISVADLIKNPSFEIVEEPDTLIASLVAQSIEEEPTETVAATEGENAEPSKETQE